MTLFVNACVREKSRTLELTGAVLKEIPGEMEELRLYPNGPEGLDTEKLTLRYELVEKKEYDHPMFQYAKQFASADVIVIAAPYWNLAFPAKVRAYLEEITVSGITFKYSEKGIPQGLCNAKKLIYVTTAGGPIIKNLGYEYVKVLAGAFYGIPEVCLVKAEMLDIWGADAAEILERAKSEIPAMIHTDK